jgi:hypothetical protein
MKLLRGVSLSRQSGAKAWVHASTQPCCAKLQMTSVSEVRAGRFCMTITTIHPAQRLLCVFSEQSTASCCRAKHRNLLPVIPLLAAIAIVTTPWPPFHAVVQQQAAALRELVHRPVQTNEVGRCAALLGGFLEVARRTGLPLRLLEVGAAAGLILRWDHYSYEVGHEGWGDPASLVRISNVFRDVYPRLDVSTRIEERRGCDTSPIDAHGRRRINATVVSVARSDGALSSAYCSDRCSAPCARPCRPRQCGRLDRGGAHPPRFRRSNGGVSLHCVAVLVECRPGASQARDGRGRAGRHS